ncbi:interleukin-1 receptor-like 1 [Clarias gariepinus]|uniref:interleukin-1 receptor-like 1 n=1 Tax=Clarias gariepinus TaxID=13013 RepID=UPI00234C8104|nr:interleukin-1 receptor-like 1 [Clarias gariepinus]
MAEISMIICFLAELLMASASIDYSVQCESTQDVHTVRVIQGEALRLPCSNLECSEETNNSLIFWFKNGSNGIQPITTGETERVHAHGPVLYFLPLSLNDTGVYITKWWYNGSNCDEFENKIEVYEKFHTDQLYGNYSEQTSIVTLYCPVCKENERNFTWYKDFRLMPDKSDHRLQIFLPPEDRIGTEQNGIYTCVCVWEHHGHIYNSSGSYQLQRKELTRNFAPTFQYPLNNCVEFVNLGGQLELNCLVFFGININDVPSVYWMRNNSRLNSNYSKNKDGIKSSFKITQVSETDLQSNYCCIAMSAQKWEFVCISLSTRESLTPVVVMFSCMLLFLLLAAAILKWFTVDLVLCFRSFGIMQSKRNDGKVYDAYVIYQKDNLDEKTERKVAHFVNKVLPAVLENTCGFKLYIQGRDDLPGEDCSELTETSMQLSRRLIAVLPLGLSRHHRVTTSLCYDWHVGLHQVVVEQEMKAILIQLGDMDDFSHLPMGLQHLLQKTPPLRWDEGSGQALCPTSRFWKQVRYMMPVPPDSRSRGVASPR